MKLSKEYEQKGISILAKKQYEKAIEYFNESIKLNPNNRSSYFRKGCALFYLKEYENAIHEFDKVLEMDTNHSDEKRKKLNIFTLINKSSVLLKLRRYE